MKRQVILLATLACVSIGIGPSAAEPISNVTTTKAVASGSGTSIYSANITSAAIAVDASPGAVTDYYFYNSNSAVCYVQFFDVAQGSVTVGTTPPTRSLGIPANGGANVSLPFPWTFATAITIAATTGRGGNTACTNGVDVNVSYK